MDTPDTQLEALLDLEGRHDDLLERLDALDKRVKKVLSECLPPQPAAESGPGPSPDPT